MERVVVGAGYTYLNATYRERRDGRRIGQQHERHGGGGRRGPRRCDRDRTGRPDSAGAGAHAEGVRRNPGHLAPVGESRSDRRVEHVRARQREQPAPARRHVLSRARDVTTRYGVVNLGVRYRLTKQLELVGQVNNLFDHHYSTAAQLGPDGFHQHRHLHRPAAAADRRRVPARERDVLRARLADHGVGRPATQDLVIWSSRHLVIVCPMRHVRN